jgi:hypothetical protein
MQMAIIISTTLHTNNNKMTRSSSINIALFVGLALTAMVHIWRLNQGLWGHSSSLNKTVVVSRSVVIQQSKTTAAVTFDPTITDDTRQAASEQHQPQPQPQPQLNCSSQSNGEDGNSTRMTAPEWLKIRGNHARWLHIGKAGGKKAKQKKQFMVFCQD